jgi:hypothetical protein
MRGSYLPLQSTLNCSIVRAIDEMIDKDGLRFNEASDENVKFLKEDMRKVYDRCREDGSIVNASYHDLADHKDCSVARDIVRRGGGSVLVEARLAFVQMFQDLGAKHLWLIPASPSRGYDPAVYEELNRCEFAGVVGSVFLSGLGPWHRSHWRHWAFLIEDVDDIPIIQMAMS